MRLAACLVGAALILVAAAPAPAGDFDGSKLLICAPVEAVDCAPGSACEKGTPEEIGLPAFFRIDFANKALIGPKRTSAIQLIEKSDRQLLLQGTELGLGWTVALDPATGKISATLTDRDGAFVLFGACTPP